MRSAIASLVTGDISERKDIITSKELNIRIDTKKNRVLSEDNKNASSSELIKAIIDN